MIFVQHLGSFKVLKWNVFVASVVLIGHSGPMEFRLKVLLVEDETLVSSLLASTLSSTGFDVAESRNSSEAVKTCKRFDPDVALIDVDLGQGPSGIDVAHRLRMENETIGILFLTNISVGFMKNLVNSFDKGPYGYLPKDSVAQLDDLANAVKLASRGIYDHSELEDTGEEKLTASQFEVLTLLSKGQSVRQIAKDRNTSTRAVNRVIHRACVSLGVEGENSYHRIVNALKVFKD